jgi:Fe-S-cluster-containing hydrogenase component 2
MLRAEVSMEVCQGCSPCPARRICRLKALMQIDPGEPAVVELTRCRGCGDCVAACPYAAIAIRNAQMTGAHSA